MTTWLVIAIVAATFVFILTDSLRERRARLPKPVEPGALSAQTARLERIEAEVDRKLRVIQLHDPGTGKAASCPVPEANGKNHDTRCIQIVKEKADEFERLAREKGVGMK